MKIETITESGVTIAVVSDSKNAICDEQSAMELALQVKYETGGADCAGKRTVLRVFFILSTGLAEIHQLPAEGGHIRRFFTLHQQAAERLYL